MILTEIFPSVLETCHLKTLKKKKKKKNKIKFNMLETCHLKTVKKKKKNNKKINLTCEYLSSLCYSVISTPVNFDSENLYFPKIRRENRLMLFYREESCNEVLILLTCYNWCALCRIYLVVSSACRCWQWFPISGKTAFITYTSSLRKWHLRFFSEE